MIKQLSRMAFTAFAIALLSITAHGATIAFKADLKASTEVPPNDGAGAGKLSATLNSETMEFKYHIVYSGLSGPAVAAHFHGPAAAGANAGPQVPIKGSVASPIDGTATLTADQVKDLEAGKWYFNVHTKAHPGGEIRGQIMKGK
jgi:hypothetical protein